MEKLLKKQGKQKGAVQNTILTGEIYRAVAMMKRVKKAANVQSENEAEKMPSFLIPDAIVLCQSVN